MFICGIPRVTWPVFPVGNIPNPCTFFDRSDKAMKNSENAIQRWNFGLLSLHVCGNFWEFSEWDLVFLLWIWKDQFLGLKILETVLFNKLKF